jgi:hypothetical protein
MTDQFYRRTSRRATPEEEAAVEHVEILTPKGAPGVYTGIVSTLESGDVAVLLYSARCVHDIAVIPASWVIKRTLDPRPIDNLA